MAEEQAVEDCIYQSQDIFEKLNILCYQKELVQNKGMKPLFGDYFGLLINQNEQFSYFKALVKWLFIQNNIKDQDISSYDDPNTVGMNIQGELRKMNINLDVSGIKLKNGFGKHVCEVLGAIINHTLKTKKITLKQPIFPASGTTDDNKEMAMDDEEEDGIDMDDNLIINDDDDDEIGIENYLAQDKQVIQPRAEEKEWILECQRVRSKLEERQTADHKEWRQHIERAKLLSEGLKKHCPGSKKNLERLSDKIGNQLERILSRENQINKAMTDIGEEFKDKNNKNKEINEQVTNITSRVKDSSEEYNRLTEKYEKLKARLDEYENTATNDEPLIKLKKACADLKGEIKQMDVRIGVLSHIVLKHSHLLKKEKIENTLNRGAGRAQNQIIVEDPNMEDLEDDR